MALNSVTKLTQPQIADAWAKITVKVWKDKMAKLKIGNSRALMDSFIHEVISSFGGDLMKIEFAFKYYGKFVDMGVGKGVKIGSVKESATSRRLEGKMMGNRRRPKKWYSKTFSAEVMRLTEIMQREYLSKYVAVIMENISDNSIKGGARIKI
jgi:hypothetical protein